MVCVRWGIISEFKNIDLFFKWLCGLGPSFQYFPEESMSILVVMENNMEKADNFERDNGSNFKIKT